jgi:hypothetical protein
MNHNCEDNIKKDIEERLAACERTVEPINSMPTNYFLKRSIAMECSVEFP